MKRANELTTLVVLLLAGSISLAQQGQVNSAQPPPKSAQCSFDITGLWRTDATSEQNPIYFDFLPEGSVVLLSFSRNALPQEFETIESVKYKLNKPSNPKSIEFVTSRGNDVFVQGVTLLEMVGFDDNSFTTKNVASGEQRHWTREETHKYFLSFVARAEGNGNLSTAFAMWSMLDGRETKLETLGAYTLKDGEKKSEAVFGRVPPAIYDNIREQTEDEKAQGKEEVVVMRFELSRREFAKTHKIFETWNRSVEKNEMRSNSPFIDIVEFIRQVADNLDSCGKSKHYKKLDRERVAGIQPQIRAQNRSLELIKAIRANNLDLHIPDRSFPWGWRPMIQLPAQ